MKNKKDNKKKSENKKAEDKKKKMKAKCKEDNAGGHCEFC